jgi:hypothetical protein
MRHNLSVLVCRVPASRHNPNVQSTIPRAMGSRQVISIAGATRAATASRATARAAIGASVDPGGACGLANSSAGVGFGANVYCR